MDAFFMIITLKACVLYTSGELAVSSAKSYPSDMSWTGLVNLVFYDFLPLIEVVFAKRTTTTSHNPDKVSFYKHKLNIVKIKG